MFGRKIEQEAELRRQELLREAIRWRIEQSQEKRKTEDESRASSLLSTAQGWVRSLSPADGGATRRTTSLGRAL